MRSSTLSCAAKMLRDASEEQAELDLRDGDDIVVGVERRVEDHLHTRRDPEVWREQDLPVGLDAVLISPVIPERRSVPEVLDWLRPAPGQSELTSDAKRLQIRYARVHGMALEREPEAAAFGRVVRTCRRPSDAVPYSESQGGLTAQRELPR